MTPGYLAGLCADLLQRCGHPQLNAVKPWRGLEGGDHERGLWVDWSDGSALGLKTVGGGPPTGGPPTGPDVYDPDTDRPPGSVAGLGQQAPTGARGCAGLLRDLLTDSAHPNVVAVEVPERERTHADEPVRVSVRVTIADRGVLYVLMVSAVAPGGRRLAPWDTRGWGGMA